MALSRPTLPVMSSFLPCQLQIEFNKQSEQAWKDLIPHLKNIATDNSSPASSSMARVAGALLSSGPGGQNQQNDQQQGEGAQSQYEEVDMPPPAPRQTQSQTQAQTQTQQPLKQGGSNFRESTEEEDDDDEAEV